MQPPGASLWLVLYCVCVRACVCGVCTLVHGCMGFGRVEQNLDVVSIGSAEAFLQPPASSISVLSVWTLVSCLRRDVL